MAQQRKIGDSDKSISAVEWLQMKMAISSPEEMVENINVWFKEAKQMEKEQIIDAFGVGCQVESTRLIGYHGMAEQYYNETYKP